jgi:hypothetical protein
VTALKASTASSYGTALNHLQVFATSHGIDRIFPLSVPTLMGFAVYLSAFKHLAFSTVKKYISGIRSFSVDGGFDLSAFASPLLARLYRGIRKNCPSRARRSRICPITTVILHMLINHVRSPLSGTEIAIMAALCVGVFGLFRTVEIVQKSFYSAVVRRMDVEWHEDFVIIHLRESKTDTFRKGCPVRLFRMDSPICAYTALARAWRMHSNRSSIASIFQDEHGHALSFRSFQSTVSAWLREIGFTQTHWQGFSMRRGGATSLALAGVPAHVIRAMGRWSSLCYQRYIHMPSGALRQAACEMAPEPSSTVLSFRGAFGGIPPREAASISMDNIEIVFGMRGNRPRGAFGVSS